MLNEQRQELGEYIVSDPEICGGALTFKGTRIFVKDVLELVAVGMSREQITQAWFGRVSHSAIAEAIAIANDDCPVWSNIEFIR